MMGLRARSVAPAPSVFLLVGFILSRASGVATRPGPLAAGKRGLCLELGRWSQGLCSLSAFSDGHLLALA